jgi:Proton-conducting membrane transporter/LAGLIDADG endonuclease
LLLRKSCSWLTPAAAKAKVTVTVCYRWKYYNLAALKLAGLRLLLLLRKSWLTPAKAQAKAQYQISIPPLNLFYVSNLYGKFFVFFDSTISHIGFLLLSLAINTEQSIDSFLFYLIQYTITNLNIFLIILAITYNYDKYRESNSYRTTNNHTPTSPVAFAKGTFPWPKGPLEASQGQEAWSSKAREATEIKLRQQIEIRYIYDLKGLFFTNPLLSLSLGISLFSMAGLPPVKNYGKILYWEKLSNSGDTLKLMIPNYRRKAICGWSNHSGAVTSHKMSENEMGYRGSKSVLVASTVKEQRVDGSYYGSVSTPRLRCTLTGCERSYQIKIPSKQLKNKRAFSTVNIQPKLNPWFVTGLSDLLLLRSDFYLRPLRPGFTSAKATAKVIRIQTRALAFAQEQQQKAESSVIIRISKNTKNKRTKIGWIVSSNFQITLHQRELSLLLILQQFFGGIGKINIDPKHESSKYTIIKLNDLKIVIIPHFENSHLLQFV